MHARSTLSSLAVVAGAAALVGACTAPRVPVPDRPGVSWKALRPATPAKAGATDFPSKNCEAFAKRLTGEMILDEKIGQMVQPDYERLGGVASVTSDFIGSVLNGGNGGPTIDVPNEWVIYVGRVKRAADQSPLGIPLLYGIDAVHGHNDVKGATMFPHQIGLGATHDAALVRRVARATAEEVVATGINWTFSPVFAACRDERWGRSYECFSEEPELARKLGTAMVLGYQTDRLGSRPTSVLATAKHFAGDGGTKNGKDRGNAEYPMAEFRRLHVDQYKAAIDAGVGSVMVSYSKYNGVPMHAHKELVTGVLKQEMGFKGFVISDYEAIERIGGTYESQVERSINAGLDMIMSPKKHDYFMDTTKALVKSGKIPMSRIDDAVQRILTIKCEMGLGETGEPPLPIDTVGSAEHRKLAREAASKSLVLLQNRNRVLPLKKNLTKVMLAGSAVDDLGMQCGGWTVDWQGRKGDLTEGTNLKEAVEKVLPRAEIVHDHFGRGGRGADVAIVAIGEEPYAEMQGDRTDLPLPADDVATVKTLARDGIPVVVVLFTGRPLILQPILEDASAIVAAWLPGTEGEGVTDVLFGDRKPTGKLTVTWPKSMDQIPINVGDETYDPLYPFGHGLTYE